MKERLIDALFCLDVPHIQTRKKTKSQLPPLAKMANCVGRSRCQSCHVNHGTSDQKKTCEKKTKQGGRPGIGQRDSASLLDAVNHVKSDLKFKKNPQIRSFKLRHGDSVRSAPEVAHGT